MTHKIMTWAQTRSLTLNWMSQPSTPRWQGLSMIGPRGSFNMLLCNMIFHMEGTVCNDFQTCEDSKPIFLPGTTWDDCQQGRCLCPMAETLSRVFWRWDDGIHVLNKFPGQFLCIWRTSLGTSSLEERWITIKNLLSLPGRSLFISHAHLPPRQFVSWLHTCTILFLPKGEFLESPIPVNLGDGDQKSVLTKQSTFGIRLELARVSVGKTFDNIPNWDTGNLQKKHHLSGTRQEWGKARNQPHWLLLSESRTWDGAFGAGN